MFTKVNSGGGKLGNLIHFSLTSCNKALRLSLFMFFAICFATVNAETTIESNFTDKNLTVGTDELGWTSSVSANNIETTSNGTSTFSRGVQFGTKNSPVGTFTLTAKSELTAISKVEIVASTNYTGNSLSVAVGSTSFSPASATISSGTSAANSTYTFSSESTVDGTIVITVNDANRTVWIKKIIVTYTSGGSSTTTVAAPTFSPAGGTYTEAQTVYLTTTTEGARILYTTDGTTPSLESYTDNKCELYSDETGITVSESMTINAVAIDNDDYTESDVSTATYTIISLDLTGDGSFENPYTVSDIKLMKKNNFTVSGDEWVKGYIVGSVKSSTALYDEGKDVDTNIALADDAESTTDFIPVELPSGYLRKLVNVKSNTDNNGKLVYVYGKRQDYFSVAGIKSTSKVYGLTTVKIAFSEGYGTYYSNYPFEMPEGVTGCIITDANVGSGTLTIEEKYTAGETVPACTGLLLKGEANASGYDVVNTKLSPTAPEDNLLKGSAEAATTEGGTYYYMLSHDKKGENVGFYWGAENGGAFTNKAGKAYLALDAATAAKAFVLDGSTTGISAIADESSNAAVYTLSGMKLNGEKLQKGIYIKNGRKFVVK